QSAHGVDPALITLLPRRGGLFLVQRANPHVGPSRRAGIAHRSRHDTDDDMRLAIEQDGAADDATIGTEPSTPQSVVEHDDALPAFLQFVRMREASDLGVGTGRLKEVRRTMRRIETFGGTVTGGCHAPPSRRIPESRHLGERLLTRTPV